jgi:hypothetical protein
MWRSTARSIRKPSANMTASASGIAAKSGTPISEANAQVA